MYKYFLYPLLISLFIYSCANQRNAKDKWDKKRITTACDCADMAKDVFTEIISDIRKNPGLSMDSIMNSKETVWKPRFKRCDEIEKERRQSETSSFEEELEQCESAKELESLMDTLAQLVRPTADLHGKLRHVDVMPRPLRCRELVNHSHDEDVRESKRDHHDDAICRV